MFFFKIFDNIKNNKNDFKIIYLSLFSVVRSNCLLCFIMYDSV